METEIVEIKKGSEVSSADLIKSGWKNTGRNFGFSQVWEKENEKMLYDHDAKKVSLIFSS